MAVFSAAGNLGLAAGSTVIGFFIAAWGWRSTPWLALPAVAVVTLLFVLLPPRRIDEYTKGRTEITLRGLAADRAGLAAILRLVFINFSITVGLRGLQTFLGIHLTDLGASLKSVGLLTTRLPRPRRGGLDLRELPGAPARAAGPWWHRRSSPGSPLGRGHAAAAFARSAGS